MLTLHTGWNSNDNVDIRVVCSDELLLIRPVVAFCAKECPKGLSKEHIIGGIIDNVCLNEYCNYLWKCHWHIVHKPKNAVRKAICGNSTE